MYIFLIVLHVVVCLVLIFVVLLQAGRGGGFSDMMGSGQPQSVFGTQTNAFMTRATEVCAVLFIVTSLSLGMLSTQRGKSLIEKNLSKINSQAASMPVPLSKTQPIAAEATQAAEAVAVPAAAQAQAPVNEGKAS